MKKSEYCLIERYMQSCMKDSAHDREHIYRVLYTALDIAEYEKETDRDLLVAACLLHDIGREEQYRNPAVRHEIVGAEKAYHFLIENRWPENRAGRVRDCILSHRYRSSRLPDTVEAKILFDADKLDATGALGIARTLCYKALVSEPLYSLDETGSVSDGSQDERPSFFQEYKYKLEKLYDRFYTQRGSRIAQERKKAAESFYNSLLSETQDCYAAGAKRLSGLLENE